MKTVKPAMMKTECPIVNFLQEYQEKNLVRAHMPGHKGRLPFELAKSSPALAGVFPMDITEVSGADILSAPEGILLESENRATEAFGTRHTYYSTEGSSQVIRAMLYLAATHPRVNGSQNQLSQTDEDRKEEKTFLVRIAAGRNVHRAFLSAAALLPLDICWIPPEGSGFTLTAWPVSPACLEKFLQTEKAAGRPVDYVFITSPDYLGNVADIRGLARVCHKMGAALLVDNAHGAYLKFLPEDRHPITLGADMTADSAHKTLPALTGTAYLQVGKKAPDFSDREIREALALFGSTSPSWLLLASLDLLNPYLQKNIFEDIQAAAERVQNLMEKAAQLGILYQGTGTGADIRQEPEPLKLTLSFPGRGRDAAEELREKGVECEYADPDLVVLMLSPQNTEEEMKTLYKLLPGLAENFGGERKISTDGAESHEPETVGTACFCLPPRVLSIREAMNSPAERVPVKEAVGRVAARTPVTCPPAVAPIMPGERITEEMSQILQAFGQRQILVLQDHFHTFIDSWIDKE